MFNFTFEKLMLLEIAGKFSQKNNWNHNGKKLRCNLLVYIEDGECEFTIDNNKVSLTKNDIIIIPNNTFYIPQTATGCSYMYFWFNAEISNKIEPNTYFYGQPLPQKVTLTLPQRINANLLVQQYLTDTVNNMCSDDPLSKMQMSINFLNALIQISSQTSCSSTIFEQIKKHINTNLSSQITLTDLSEKFGYTKQHVIRIFKDNINITPTVYINNEKLKLSIKLLFETDFSIEKIANVCGFVDANYFSRVFKKRYGVSPSKYKEQFAPSL